jgi:23S rRNA (uracil1939-C5)-methyltransferase
LHPALERLVVLGGSRRGQLRISVTETETGLDVSVRDGKPLDVDLRLSLTSAVHGAAITRLTWNTEILVTIEAPCIRFGATRVHPPPDCFLQATREGEAALQASVVDAISGTDAPVVDLFSGIGTFSLPLSERLEVHCVEGDAAMLDALHDGWRTGKGLRRITVEHRDLFRRPLTSEELRAFGGAVIDPPRAGAEAQISELASSSVRHVAMVSCNPMTFARDAEILNKAGYSCVWIDVVDQFRWSPHIEVVSKFSLD